MVDAPLLVADLDGTLLDVRLRHVECYRNLLGALGHKALSGIEYWDMKRAGTPVQEMLATSGAADAIDDFRAGWLREIELPRWLALDTLFPDTLELLTAFRREGWHIILITGRQDEVRLRLQLDALGLAGCFDGVMAGPWATTAEGKAAAAAGVRGKGRAPGVWVGDTAVDCRAARTAGFRFWAVTSGLRDAAFLGACGPDFMTPTFSRPPPFPLTDWA
jgi:phosphoglycolate phosphatase-like HAD superfamily hydrolase